MILNLKFRDLFGPSYATCSSTIPQFWSTKAKTFGWCHLQLRWPLDEWKRTHNQATRTNLQPKKKTKNKTQTKLKLKQHLLERRPRTPLIGWTFRSSQSPAFNPFFVFIITKFLPFLLLSSFVSRDRASERGGERDFRKQQLQQTSTTTRKQHPQKQNHICSSRTRGEFLEGSNFESRSYVFVGWGDCSQGSTAGGLSAEPSFSGFFGDVHFVVVVVWVGQGLGFRGLGLGLKA